MTQPGGHDTAPRWNPKRRAGLLVSVGLLLLGARAWWATATSTSDARIAALSTVEPYAFAVYEQLLRNFSSTWHFFQTIHKGYGNTWDWSGHRALTLPLVGLLYGLRPSPFHLAEIQVDLVLLGVVPAALVGRRGLGSDWGLLLGGALYLLAPAGLALALQDYQDLVLALPALTFAWWAGGTGRPWLWALGTLVGLAPREECYPLAVLAVALARPGRPEGARRRLLRAAVAAGVVLVAAGLVSTYSRSAGSGFQMPLVNAVQHLLGLQAPLYLDGWAYLGSFYSLLARPLGPLDLLAPEAALPALGLVLSHMTVPAGHGVGRNWLAHAHHLAPAAAFATLAAIEGSARLLRLLRARLPVLAPLLGAALLLAAALQAPSWSRSLGLRPSAWQRLPPAWWHPAWELAAELPPSAVPIVSSPLALTVSHFPLAYTWDESLPDKAPGQGLAAGTHLIASRRCRELAERARAMPGARLLDEVGGYVLLGWEPGAPDPRAAEPLPRAWESCPLPPEQAEGRPPRPPGVKGRGAEPPASRGIFIRFPWTPPGET